MGFKTFDFFQKITMDNVTKPTMIGSFLSLTAISIMIFLFFRQLTSFYSYHTKTDSVVFQPKNSDEQISINLEIFFNSVPCNLVSLDTVDIMNNHRGDIRDTITKNKFYPNSQKLERYKEDRSYDGLVKAINAGEGCALIGKIFVNQVPGEFHVSFHNYRGLYRELSSKNHDLFEKIKLSHNVAKLSLGDTTKSEVKKFDLDSDLFFRSFDKDSTFNDPERYNYNYFLKIIPYMLVDENRRKTNYAYSFSLSSKASPFRIERDDMPEVNFKYEFSPIFMKVTHLKRDYLHFLTHVSAIVGGVFVVFSILNRIFTSLMQYNSDK